MNRLLTLARRIRANWFTKSAWVGMDPNPQPGRLDPTYESSPYTAQARRGQR